MQKGRKRRKKGRKDGISKQTGTFQKKTLNRNNYNVIARTERGNLKYYGYAWNKV
jgi:hypothetical protein